MGNQRGTPQIRAADKIFGKRMIKLEVSKRYWGGGKGVGSTQEYER